MQSSLCATEGIPKIPFKTHSISGQKYQEHEQQRNERDPRRKALIERYPSNTNMGIPSTITSAHNHHQGSHLQHQGPIQFPLPTHLTKISYQVIFWD